ncbi:MAG: hypothetical protein LBB83_07505 [Treponema sp.]|nr:hypothetical protein [Treponema sp.]
MRGNRDARRYDDGWRCSDEDWYSSKMDKPGVGRGSAKGPGEAARNLLKKGWNAGETVESTGSGSEKSIGPLVRACPTTGAPPRNALGLTT